MSKEKIIWSDGKFKTDFPEDISVDIAFNGNRLDIAVTSPDNRVFGVVKNPAVLYGNITNYLCASGINPRHAQNTIEYKGLKFEWSESEDVWPPTMDCVLLVDAIVADCANRKIQGKVFDFGTGSGIIGTSTAKLLGYDSALLCDISPPALVKSVRTAKQNGIHAVSGGRKDLEGRMKQGENIIVSNPPYFDISVFDPTAQAPSGLASSIVRLGGFNLELYKELDELLQAYAKVGYFTTSSVAEDALEFLTQRSECIAQTDFPLSNLKKAFKLSDHLPDDHTVKVWRYER